MAKYSLCVLPYGSLAVESASCKYQGKVARPELRDIGAVRHQWENRSLAVK